LNAFRRIRLVSERRWKQATKSGRGGDAALPFALSWKTCGPTGYAIIPARDLGPRIAHFLLPIPGKGSSDWGCAWIPVAGPVIGGVLGALVFRALW